MPDLLQLAVDHHSVGVLLHAHLLCEGLLLSLPGDEEGNRFFYVIEGQFLELAWQFRRF